MSVRALSLAFVLAIVGCRGPRPADSDDRLARLVDSLTPQVEAAAGLRFTAPPRSGIRSREQVRAYLVHQLERELPPAKLEGLTAAYRLFGLVPDTLDLKTLLLDLYSEQIAGYYDPDSAMLFGVAGADPAQLRLVVAHELVHALQGQHLPLDSLLRASLDNDRLTATHAILEGQATVASLEVLAPGVDIAVRPEVWELSREQIRGQQATMPVFGTAPLVVREALLFPYLAGGEFMTWWARSPLNDTVPFGPRMPVSTEQILHPTRYAAGDMPRSVAFAADSGVLYEDVLGEAELRILEATLAGRAQVDRVAPLGWGGDRYRVYATPDGPALVWVVVWDDARARDRFLAGTGAALRRSTRPGYRASLEPIALADGAATRYVLAPSGWERWTSVPEVDMP